MRCKLLIIILLGCFIGFTKPTRAQTKSDSLIIGTDTSKNNPSIMLSTDSQPTKKEKWESALIIAGISLIMVILFNARSK
jgi:hypothetical protein